MEQMVWAALPSLIVGAFMALFNRAQKKRDEITAARAEARKAESLLSLDMQMATAKMAYATAMAIKRGHANGEVEDGVAAYECAKKRYVDFLNQQAAEHLN